MELAIEIEEVEPRSAFYDDGKMLGLERAEGTGIAGLTAFRAAILNDKFDGPVGDGVGQQSTWFRWEMQAGKDRWAGDPIRGITGPSYEALPAVLAGGTCEGR